VASAAADFFQKLNAVLPPEKEDPSIEWPAYPFLQLELGFTHVERINQLEVKEKSSPLEVKERSKAAHQIIQQECVINAADKYCEQLFGVPSFPSGTKLNYLLEVWSECHPESGSKWIKALCDQILAGVVWKFPPPAWELMQGLSDSTWRAPILNRVRKIPCSQCMQFDIYFYRFEVQAGEDFARINIPRTMEQKGRYRSTMEEKGKKKEAPKRRTISQLMAAAKEEGSQGVLKVERHKGKRKKN
jgi:hypothetical protein